MIPFQDMSITDLLFLPSLFSHSVKHFDRMKPLLKKIFSNLSISGAVLSFLIWISFM